MPEPVSTALLISPIMRQRLHELLKLYQNTPSGGEKLRLSSQVLELLDTAKSDAANQHKGITASAR